MNVKWTKFAQRQRREIARYIAMEFGKKAAEKFYRNVAQWVRSIACNPGIGIKEPLLAERPEGFRSIVISRQNKLVYYVKTDTLYIAALWDTRREPAAQADNIK